MKMLRSSTVNENFPDGFSMDWPADPLDAHLGDIVMLLWNGRNIKVTLTKDDGSAVHYELVEV